MPDGEGPSLRARALRLLARRDRSLADLRARLAPHAVDETELDVLLEELSRRGWLSDARVAEQHVHARRGRYGAERIRHELAAKGVAAEVIASTVSELGKSDLPHAREAWRKRFGRAPADAGEAARQMRFLMARGFGAEIARRVVRERGRDED